MKPLDDVVPVNGIPAELQFFVYEGSCPGRWRCGHIENYLTGLTMCRRCPLAKEETRP